MKIGILGGTFNPIHIGHIIIANYVLHEFNLDMIHFIPAYQTTYKKSDNNTMHRKKMIKSAITNNDNFLLNDIELKNKELSYTYNTIKTLYNGKDQYFIILGNEWFPGFNKWYNYKSIFKYAKLIIVKRLDKKTNVPEFLAGYKTKIFFSNNPVIDISSSMIRDRIKKGRDIRYLVPGKVDEYIKKNGLYNL